MSGTESLEQVRRLARERIGRRLMRPTGLISRARRKLFSKWFETAEGNSLVGFVRTLAVMYRELRQASVSREAIVLYAGTIA